MPDPACYGLDAFIAYWETEGAVYARQGDYGWMATLAPGKRVLEIGCGAGFGTVALAGKGVAVLAMDMQEACLAATRRRVATANVEFLRADVSGLDEAALARVRAFRPETVVCWLLGAPSGVTGATAADPRQAVSLYRERVHRKVAELAADLPDTKAVHLVDRTVIPWQAKDLGREVLVRYHLDKTFAGLPFTSERRDALYRKLADGIDTQSLRRARPALKSVTPVLASFLARRRA
ncbi:MAG: class I SAM-dependent methyltransferase [Zoogloeaceae bacterium]|nr:class I SAM-dependent methyltransferase [Zoogloeaceae bacterium]